MVALNAVQNEISDTWFTLRLRTFYSVEPIIIIFILFNSINPFFPGEFEFLNQLVILIKFRNCQRAAAVYDQIAVFVLHTADES